MSSRQLRRLQDLVASATGADGEEDDELAMPATMKPAKDKSRKSKKRKPQGPHETGDPTASPVSPRDDGDLARGEGASETESKHRDTTVHSTDSPPLTSDKPASPTVAAKEADTAALLAEQARREAEKTAKREAKKAAKAARRKRQEAEEEALLQAAVAQHAGDPHGARPLATAATNDDNAAAVDDEHNPNTQLMRHMMRADSARLDMRNERIRNFGPEAVEDVGDGSVPKRRADGRPADTGSTSFFPEHGGKLRFRACAFATPNRYRWPPYDSLGMSLQVVGRPDPPVLFTPDPSSSPAEMHYALDTDSGAFRRADEARALCVAMNAPVQGLLDCLANHGCYHIPTLLQLSETLELTGSTAHAQELVDLALYQAGLMLSHIHLEGTWATRQLRACQGGNELLLLVLARSVHVALRRGCTRTAFETARFLLSLDPLDPTGVLLQLDYAALRSKRWVWLVKAYTLMEERLAREAGPSNSGGDDFTRLLDKLATASREQAPPLLSHTDLDATLALDMARLPSFAFSAALAKHFLEREAARETEEATAGTRGRPYRSKVLREATEEEQAMLARAPSAQKMLAYAIATFPEATQRLLDELQGVDHVCRGAGHPVDPFWSTVLQPAVAAEDGQGSLQGLAAEQHKLGELFAARHADLWKVQTTVAFLRDALAHAPLADGAAEPTSWLRKAHAEVRERRAWLAAFTARRTAEAAAPDAARTHSADLCSLRGYTCRTRDEVLGSAGTAIPADVLEQAQQPAEGELDQAQVQAMAAHARQLRRERDRGLPLSDTDRDALLRYEALYEPLDADRFPTERDRLEEYRERLRDDDVQAQLLRGMDPVQLFFRMMLPQNNTESLTLRAMLEQRGIEDPVRRRELDGRAADERIWAEDEAAAEAAEDSEAEWAASCRMFWRQSESSGSSSSGATPSSGSTSSTDAFTLEDRLRRVSRDDLSAVTVEDIERLKATVDHDTLTSAMLVMLETNRFSDVLSCSSSSAWNAAARDVTAVQRGSIGTLVRLKTSLLYGVLPYVSEDFLEVMRTAFASKPEDEAGL